MSDGAATAGAEALLGLTGGARPRRRCASRSEDVEELVIGALGASALFSSHFRENAARALLLPRRRPGQRTPLWQMRQRSAQLLAVASRYGSFPIILETYRECLQDVFDLPALRGVLAAIERREIRIVSVETRRASPFASSLMFDYIASYMYEGDAPLVDRRAQALALDRDLLRELLGAEELRELLDADALAELELELQSLTDERAAGSADAVHDLLRRLGDLRRDEVAARVRGAGRASARAAAGEWLEALAADRRAVRVRIAGEERWIATEDAGALPRRARRRAAGRRGRGVPHARRRDAARAACSARWARHHGPFLADRAGRALGPAGRRDRAGARAAAGRRARCCAASSGPTASSASGATRRSCACCAADRWPGCGARSSRSSRARWARFLPALAGRRRRAQAASTGWPRSSPSSRACRCRRACSSATSCPRACAGYSPRLLDELGAAGEVVWVGLGRLGQDDGRVALYRPDRLACCLLPDADAPDAATPRPMTRGCATSSCAHLARRGASFYRDLLGGGAAAAARDGRAAGPEPARLLDALWDLVWATRGDQRHVRAAARAALAAPARAGGERGHARGRRADGVRRRRPDAGRWSPMRVATRRGPGGGERRPTTERRHAHGAAAARAPRRRDARHGRRRGRHRGGFGAVYPVLREMEERGRVRRGYFVEGLGGAQFALPGAVDRLRAARPDPRATNGPGWWLVLAATDPANPYGAALAVAAPRRRRPASVAARRRRQRRAGRRGAGARARARRAVAPDACRRPTTPTCSRRRSARWRPASPTAGCAALEIQRVDGAAGRQLGRRRGPRRGRLPRLVPRLAVARDDPAVASPDHVRARRRPLRRAVRPRTALGPRRRPGAVWPRRLGLGRGLDDRPTAASPRIAIRARSGTTPRTDDLAAVETTAVLAHLRRPSRLEHDRPCRHAAVPRSRRPLRLQPQRRPAGLPHVRAPRMRLPGVSRVERTPRSANAGSRITGPITATPPSPWRRCMTDSTARPTSWRWAPTARRTCTPATRRTRSSRFASARIGRRLDRPLFARPLALPARRSRSPAAPRRPSRPWRDAGRDGAPHAPAREMHVVR